MSLSLIDIAKLLLVQEEQSQNSSLTGAINDLKETIANQPKAQAVKATTSTVVTEGKYEYINENRENYLTSGTLYDTTKDVIFKIFLVSTPTEWTNLSLYINKKLWLQGDYEYYNTIGFAYFIYDTNTYVFHLNDEEYKDGVKITIDKGIMINQLSIIGKIST